MEFLAGLYTLLLVAICLLQALLLHRTGKPAARQDDEALKEWLHQQLEAQARVLEEKQAQQAQQEKAPQQQERPTAGRIVDDGTKWTVAIRYKDGSETVSRFSNEDIARKAYETIRMLDRGIAESNLSRMTLTHKNSVVKAYERD